MSENISKFLRKTDMVLIIVLALIPCVMMAFNLIPVDEGRARLEISMDGKILGTYSLTEDRVIKIGDGNTCRIEDGEVFMSAADCPDQICVDHAHIMYEGETIVCLPHRLIITIISKEGSETDAISQ